MLNGYQCCCKVLQGALFLAIYFVINMEICRHQIDPHAPKPEPSTSPVCFLPWTSKITKIMCHKHKRSTCVGLAPLGGAGVLQFSSYGCWVGLAMGRNDKHITAGPTFKGSEKPLGCEKKCSGA